MIDKLYDGMFVECDTCRAKPGSPMLCEGCLHNRQLISTLTQKIEKLEEKKKKLKKKLKKKN